METLQPGSALTSVVISSTFTRMLDSFKRDKILHRDCELHVYKLSEYVGLIESYRNACVMGDQKMYDWYIQLKNVAYDAVDALEAYAATVDENESSDTQMEKLKNIWRNWVKMGNDTIYTITNHVLNVECDLRLARTIELMNEKIEKIYKTGEIRGYQKRFDHGMHGFPRSSISDDDHPILGRDEKMYDIIRKLQSDNNGVLNKNLRVLAMVGMGGIGKTTLAQSVYNAMTGSFDCSAWVPITSSNAFDPETLLKIISIKFGDKQQPSDLDDVTTALARTVKTRKFLLVLDDVWCKEQRRWDYILSPLKRGKTGSKLIITTRDKEVVEIIETCHRGGVEPIVPLDGLDDRNIWEIMKNHAFGGGEIDVPEELERIGNDIAKKLKGLPLAAKAMGRVLGYDTSESHWETIRDSHLWNAMGSHKQYDENLIPALTLSFLYLPSEAKPCFTYCSLFPKGREIDTRELVYQWLVHDYLLDKDKKSGEDMGEDIINVLHSMSLVTGTQTASAIKMHDLIHDLSMASGSDDHLQVLDAGMLENLPEKSVRHLGVYIDKYSTEKSLENVGNCKMLRTLIFDCQDGIEASILPKWFKQLQRLRVLKLCNLKGELPEEIRELKQLRYLDLSGVDVKKLPNDLVKLRHLRVLILRASTYHVFHLPSRRDYLWNSPVKLEILGRLSELRYLHLSGNCDFKALPESISALSDLRVLSLSACYDLETLPDGIGNLQRLECLDLRGSCAIRRLPESITSFSNLRMLLLSSCIELEQLPDGIGNLKRLERLDLRDCVSINKLPEDFGSLSHVKELDMDDCDALHSLKDCQMSNLKNLRRLHAKSDLISTIRGIGKLTLLESIGWNRRTYCHDAHDIEQLANLNKLGGQLKIRNLDALRSKDDAKKANLQRKTHSSGLELEWNPDDGKGTRDVVIEEEILECLKPHKDLRELTIRNYIGWKLPSWLTGQYLSYLKHLKLDGLPQISVIDDGDFGSSQILESLEFVNLPNLSQWGGADNRDQPQFSRLSYLSIRACPNLQTLPEIPLSLEEMELEGVGWSKLPSLQRSETTPSSSSSCNLDSSLHTIMICRCPFLQSLSEGVLESPLPHLRLLCIQDCENLKHPPRNGFAGCTSLESLRLITCPKLRKLSTESRVSLPPRLRVLEIADCASIETESLEMPLRTLTSLDSIFVRCKLNNFNTSETRHGLSPPPSSISFVNAAMRTLMRTSETGSIGLLDQGFYVSTEAVSNLPQIIITLTPEDEDINTKLRIHLEHGEHDTIDGYPHAEHVLKNLQDCHINELFFPKAPDLIFLIHGIFGRFLRDLINSENRPILVKCEEELFYEPHTIYIKGFKTIKSLNEGVMNDPWPHVRKLMISDCVNLLIPPKRGFITFPALESLTLERCPKLTKLSSDDCGALPSSLQELFIHDCGSLETDSLVKSLQTTFTSLKKLELENSPSRVSNSFLKGLLHLLPNLSWCSIKDPTFRICYVQHQGRQAGYTANTGCEFGREVDVNYNRKDFLIDMLKRVLPHGIVQLSVGGVNELDVIDGQLHQLFCDLIHLGHLTVSNLENLRYLPSDMSSLSSLTKLEIIECDSFSPPNVGWAKVDIGKAFLELTSLQHLKICNCNKLCSLPYSFFLQTLDVQHCDGIQDLSNLNCPMPYLKRLSISNCLNLKNPPDNGFMMLASLETLILKDCPNLSKLSKIEENCDLPSSLKVLEIDDCKELQIGHIEIYLQAVTSLRSLVIRNCKGHVSESLIKQVLTVFPREKPYNWQYVLSTGGFEFKVRYFNQRPTTIVAIAQRKQDDDNGDSCNCLEFLLEMLKLMTLYDINLLCITGIPEGHTIVGRLKEVLLGLTSLDFLKFVNCGNLPSVLQSHMEGGFSSSRTLYMMVVEEETQEEEEEFEMDYMRMMMRVIEQEV